MGCRSTRPDLLFEVFQISNCFNHSPINDIINGSKLLRKAKQERAFLKLGSPGKKENFRTVWFNDASLSNNKDRGS